MRTPDYPSADSERWAAVDAYFAGLLAPSAATLDEALSANEAAGIPAHDVSALQGKMLALFARMVGARRILEIGTLGGYSTIWMARALQRRNAGEPTKEIARTYNVSHSTISRL